MKNETFALVDLSNNIYNIDINVYPDNCPIIRGFSGGGPFKAIICRPLTMTDFMGAMFWYDAWKWRGGYQLDLILPFIPGARQDRLNDEGDFLFTLKSIAEMINARDFKHVKVLDPHSMVAPALIDLKTQPYTAMDVFNLNYYRFPSPCPYTFVLSPDAGAEKRARGIAEFFNLPLVNGWKKRNIKTGELEGFGTNYVGGKGFGLVVDDICDGGGTFIGLAKTFAPDVELDLYVTHGIFSKGVKELAKFFKNIYTTDSVTGKNFPEVKVLEFVKHML